mmetsp:Transcript_114118/g.202242  ORF Transcript_114118/g.202242 Transcript_114118/m.202242 type:complete len:253 (-) Transcript_114118:34-792(-)
MLLPLLVLLHPWKSPLLALPQEPPMFPSLRASLPEQPPLVSAPLLMLPYSLMSLPPAIPLVPGSGSEIASSAQKIAWVPTAKPSQGFCHPCAALGDCSARHAPLLDASPPSRPCPRLHLRSAQAWNSRPPEIRTGCPDSLVLGPVDCPSPLQAASPPSPLGQGLLLLQPGPGSAQRAQLQVGALAARCRLRPSPPRATPPAPALLAPPASGSSTPRKWPETAGLSTFAAPPFLHLSSRLFSQSPSVPPQHPG